MANSKLIVVEGAQGAGKTTITDYLRNSVKYTNLFHIRTKKSRRNVHWSNRLYKKIRKQKY